MESHRVLADIVTERSGKLASATPVNYSYPRTDGASSSSSYRSSLASEASAPGLVDDRTDSDVSVDDVDDCHYHAHTAELWDSFWRTSARADVALPVAAAAPVDVGVEPRRSKEPGVDDTPSMHPRKQYPALVASPRTRTRTCAAHDRRADDEHHDRPGCAWPLPDAPSPSPRDRERNRKPAATYTASPRSRSRQKPLPRYSAFPKPVMLPPPSPTPTPAPRPVSMMSTTTATTRPARPPCPTGEPLAPCIRLLTPCRLSAVHGDDTAVVPPLSPTMMMMDWRPSSPGVPGRPPTRCLHHASASPPTAHAHVCSAEATRSSTHLPLSPRAQPPTTRAPRHCKSIPHLATPPRPEPEPEPHSVFEYDSDTDDDNNRRSFFRFHRRYHSDNRCAAAKTSAPEASAHGRRRTRALTAPSSPVRQQPNRLCKQEASGRKRQGHDVLRHMLGRRGR